MSEIISLPAEVRDEVGTGVARALRKRGMVPAIIYGAGKKPLSIALEEKEITKYYRRPQFISQVFELEIGEKKHKVLPKAIQLHPVSEIVSHVDFVFLEKSEQILEVPIVYANKETCIGVKRGGYFNTVRRTIKISCPVNALPRKIELDVSTKIIGTSIKAKELVLPEGAQLLCNSEFVIASIVGRKGKNEATAEGGEAAA